jgi:hypothetical protein
MNTDLFPKFKELYDVFRKSDDYRDRVEQSAIVPINKEIIQETLKNDPLKNEHLTGLIQLFKHGCSNDTFDKYLDQNVADLTKVEEISEKAYEVNQWGYTGAGLNAVTNLTEKQLQTIKAFLRDAFEINSIEAACNLCENFDAEGIPQVKSGIYSPWLHYINPGLFPILNNSHIKFRTWIGIPADYSSCIKDFNELKQYVNEADLGVIDKFAHMFDKYGSPTETVRILDLKGKRFYKVSHGIFKKEPQYKYSGIADILAQNNWACLHSNTGKGAGHDFQYDAEIGDYIYICYGGDELFCIGKIVSPAKLLPKEHNDLFKGDGKWIYREFEPVVHPQIKSVHEFKKDNRFFMPSGNSTFYEVPKEQLGFMNENIWEPKMNIKLVDSNIQADSRRNNGMSGSSLNIGLNSILFGPPGTGKTYHSINYATAIIEGQEVEKIAAEERSLVKNRFDQYIQDGRVVFCTFHQSMNYEDFIEGIKPVEPMSETEGLFYSVEDGIFKRLCTEASFAFVDKNKNETTGHVLDFSSQYDRFLDNINESLSKGASIELPTRSGGKLTVESVSERNNIWVRHYKGSRPYTVSKKRLAKLSQAFPDLNDVTNIDAQFRAEIGGSNSSAYWTVLNAIRNQQDREVRPDHAPIGKVDYSYEDKKEIIKSLRNEDYETRDSLPFVLIIDEINRGNVSQIFGELITLLEEDKRLGASEALKAVLPYSGDSFGVPPNLFIISTMNTADRSVEAIDTALRRRFSFVAKLPEEGKLNKDVEGIDLSKVLRTINSRLRVLKDNDHTIGHAWLWNVKNVEQLKSVYGNKILPLLQEYFYNDYEKLGLVLGNPFFKTQARAHSSMFAPFKGGNGLANQYNQSWQFELKSAAELTKEDFQTLENITNAQDTAG